MELRKTPTPWVYLLLVLLLLLGYAHQQQRGHYYHYGRPPLRQLQHSARRSLLADPQQEEPAVAAAAIAVDITGEQQQQQIVEEQEQEQELELELEQYLSTVNRPFVESHVLSDGTTVDCVRIQDQLALQHPLLRNHTVLQPPSPAAAAAFHTTTSTTSSTGTKLQQTFQAEAGRCPSGTAPVLRTLRRHVRRFLTPAHSHRKYSTVGRAGNRTASPPALLHPSSSATGAPTHQYAIAESSAAASGDQQQPFAGALSLITTWSPYVAADSDFSLSQIWVGAGAGTATATVEAGWQVYPLLTGDRRPHLFVYWTADAYRATGCYNLRCPGFVQTSPDVVLGAAMADAGSGGAAAPVRFVVFRDPLAWWLQVGDAWVGYWPAALFPPGDGGDGAGGLGLGLGVRPGAEWVQWGGEVCLTNGADSGTQMGSGWVPGGRGLVASHEGVQAVQGGAVRDARGLVAFASDARRYGAVVEYGTQWGTSLFYGGPGGGSR